PLMFLIVPIVVYLFIIPLIFRAWWVALFFAPWISPLRQLILLTYQQILHNNSNLNLVLTGDFLGDVVLVFQFRTIHTIKSLHAHSYNQNILPYYVGFRSLGIITQTYNQSNKIPPLVRFCFRRHKHLVEYY